MVYELDELDLKIIHELYLNGRISVTELAKKVNSSRPTITSRLKKFIDEDLVIIKGGLNLRKYGFKMAHVGLEVKTDETRREFENYLKNCPRILHIYRTHEKANLHIEVWGENDLTINSTIESFRDHLNVDVIFTHYLGTPIQGDIIIDIVPNKTSETPCDLVCSDCIRYQYERCVGCPASSDYKNPLLSLA